MSREKLHLDRENLAQVITRCASAPSALQSIPSEEAINETARAEDDRPPLPERRKNSLPFVHVSEKSVGSLNISHGFHSINRPLSRSEGNLSFASQSFSSLSELSPVKKRRVSK